MKDPGWFWLERLRTEEDVRLCRTVFHQLSQEERARRSSLMMEQIDIDIKWGFLNTDWWSNIKRWIYIHFLHTLFFKRRTLND